MEPFQTRIFIFNLFLMGLITSSHCATFIVDGVTLWKDPNISLGDSIVFRHKYYYSLYIYKTRTAFDLCNFTQATLLTNPKSTSYIWRPSRLGYFYFSFKPCQPGTKLAIKVDPQPSAAAPPPRVEAPAPTSGGVAWSSPDFPWPFLPHEKSSGGPLSSPAPIATAMAPMLPDGKGGSFPFIDSSPAVPLPASEVDSATVFPLPTSAINNAAQVVNVFGYLILQCISIVMML
ncbi:hypothetical protein V2J09_023719 [Rumex salicifolius]